MPAAASDAARKAEAADRPQFDFGPHPVVRLLGIVVDRARQRLVVAFVLVEFVRKSVATDHDAQLPGPETVHVSRAEHVA